MTMPGFFRRETITINPYVGNQGDGPTYGPPVAVKGLVTRVYAATKAAPGDATATTFAFQLPAGLQGRIRAGDKVTIRGQAATVKMATVVDGGPISMIDVEANTA